MGVSGSLGLKPAKRGSLVVGGARRRYGRERALVGGYGEVGESCAFALSVVVAHKNTLLEAGFVKGGTCQTGELCHQVSTLGYPWQGVSGKKLPRVASSGPVINVHAGHVHGCRRSINV